MISNLLSGFNEVPIEFVESTSPTEPVEFAVIPYGISNAQGSYLTALENYENVFDEMNPQYFAKDGSFAEPLSLFQEL